MYIMYTCIYIYLGSMEMSTYNQVFLIKQGSGDATNKINNYA